jgi:CheY-like chemotaxis protein
MYKKVMVIDDNPVDRYVAEKIFKKYGFAEEIVAIDSAKEGLSYLLSLKDRPEQLPHLIFLDIMMPEMNGFEFLDEYEKLPEVIKEHCIILMLTTSIHEDDQYKADQNPYVHRFLNKPLIPAVLKELEGLVQK